MAMYANNIDGVLKVSNGKDMDITYQPAESGRLLTASGKLIKVNREMISLRVEFTEGEGWLWRLRKLLGLWKVGTAHINRHSSSLISVFVYGDDGE